MSNDDQLLRAWARGDEGPGRELFERYYPIISRFFVNKSASDATELVQETFVRCLESLDRFAGDSTFRVFLLGIAKNVFYKHLRAVYKRDRIDPAITSLAAMGPSATTELSRVEQERHLLLALRRMPLEEQILLELHFWENLSGKELASFFGIPEGTVRSRIARAKRRLSAEIAEVSALVPAPAASVEDVEQWASNVREHVHSR